MRPILPILFLAVASLATAEPDFPLAPAKECTPRLGLPNFLTKASIPGADLKIAYFGGSITAQEGWRPKSLAHFRKTFPQAKFTEINAAIGGTGSDLGVFRLKQDVLDKKPDLLFVEFAVNDGSAPPEQIYRCIEGIVRQTWRTLPDCDICFVYTLTESLAPPMLEGRFPRAASAMEVIAEHYGIPSIHLAMEAARLAKEGKLIWSAELPKTDAERLALGDKVVFAPDAVHPHPETGHELYLAAIVRSLAPIRSASKNTGSHNLPQPFDPTNYERAQLLPITAATLFPSIDTLDLATDPFARNWANRLPSLAKAAHPGDVITFRFKGTRAAIYDIIGPDCGQVTFTLDDRPPQTVPRFDAFCNYHRLATLLLGTELPDTEHTVRIDIHPEPLDKAAILAQRKIQIDKPERYAGTAFYPGAILLVGELVK